MTRYRLGPLLATLVLVAAAPGCGESASDAAPVDPPPGWTTYRDSARGLAVSLPSDWHRARESLTPDLVDPHEVLSIASYPLRYRRHSRCQVPGCPLPAVDGLGRGDVLISLQERRGSGASGFPRQSRPLRLLPMSLDVGTGRRWLCARRRIADASWTPFAAAGRGFYVFVAYGHGVSADARREVRRVVSSLRFDRDAD
jgi:hypothetical protein